MPFGQANVTKIYFLGFSRVITVESKYLLVEISICAPRIIQRETWYLLKSHLIDLELQTIFVDIDHSKSIKFNAFWEIWPYNEVARKQDSLRVRSKPGARSKNLITLEKPRILIILYLLWILHLNYLNRKIGSDTQWVIGTICTVQIVCGLL